MIKDKVRMLNISCGALLSSVMLFTASAAAETRLSYGVGQSYCSTEFDSCHRSVVVNFGVEQSLNESGSIELFYLGGTTIFTGGYNSYATHYKHRFSPQSRNSFFISAGPHYYQIKEDGWFRESRTRSGFGASTKLGWQHYQPAGLGFDVSAVAKSMPGSELTTGLVFSLSYAFSL